MNSLKEQNKFDNENFVVSFTVEPGIYNNETESNNKKESFLKKLTNAIKKLISKAVLY